jgi:mannose-6-phosphate isomerase-like protein (cupin superfamily)
MLVQKDDPSGFKDEFGIRCRRLELDTLPIGAPFGSMWCAIRPGASSHSDAHDEAEMIVIVGGSGTVQAGGQSASVAQGDVVHVPPRNRHVIANTSATDMLRVLSIYWLAAPPSGNDDG